MKSQTYYSGEKALTKEEYEKLLTACDDHEDRLLLMTAVGLGLRRSDLVRVQVQNIDFDAGVLSYQEKKKGNRIRTVPIPPKLKNEMWIYIKNKNLRGGPLFSFRDRQAYNRFNSICKKAGLIKDKECIPIHALRATCAKFCQQAGWTVEETAKFLGDTVETIERHYTIPSAGEIAKAVTDKEIL